MTRTISVILTQSQVLRFFVIQMGLPNDDSV